MQPDQIVTFAQIGVSILLIVSILLQQRGTALGSAFGGGGGGSFHTSRRGVEKKLYWASIVLGVAFIGLAILRIMV